MGKQGPCYHCGVTSTPLWRNGPPEKPVLCNACGSRWRTKGTLANYTPLHARSEAEESEEHRAQRMKIMSLNKNREGKMVKRKADQQDDAFMRRVSSETNQGFRKVGDEDASNRSSSGSAVSNSESCGAVGSAGDGSELTWPAAQANVWDTTVPCKRRTCVGRPKTSSVEKLTKDLYSILQEQQSSCLSGSSDEDLLYENVTPMGSVEIGHGSVLMRHHPGTGPRGEESEASSLSFDYKSSSSSLNEAYSQFVNKTSNFDAQAMHLGPPKRIKLQSEKLQILGTPLCNIDLKDVFNFDEFAGQFTDEEQQHLMKFLPQIDSVDLPDSLRSMFESPQLKESFALFQKLVSEGIFEASSSSEDRKKLQKLALSDLTMSHLLETYHRLKDRENGAERTLNQNPSNDHIAAKRLCESPKQKCSETKGGMRSPKKVMKMKEKREGREEWLPCLSPTSVAFTFAADGSSAVSGYDANCASEDDLLLDVPSNGSFPQAELLHHP